MANVELTEDYNALRQTLFRFAEGTLIHNDYNLSLEVIANDVAGIGMGEQGAYFNKSELRQKLIRKIMNIKYENSLYLSRFCRA
jgi:hypothetical protein